MIKGAMGSADGGPKEPGDTQLAEVQHAFDSFQEDEGEDLPDRSELELPKCLIIRMPTTFGNNYGNQTVSLEFTKIEHKEEILYVCTRGSNWAQGGEQMLLTFTLGQWIVYDAEWLTDKIHISCRQAVFLCVSKNMTKPGWNMWRWNQKAYQPSNNEYSPEEWSCEYFRAETAMP